MMKCFYFVITTAILALLTVSPVSADLVELIANGNFENVTEGKFDSWLSGTDNWTAGDTLPVTVSTSPVISDTYSALCVHGTSGTNTSSCLTQPLSTLVSDFTFSCDFAMLTGGGTSTRSLNLLLQASGGANNDVSSTTNFKVADAGDETNATFQVYTGSAWEVLTELVPVPTFDTGTLQVWDGETPTINHLEVTCNWDEPTGATYDITLNGVTVSGLTYFQGSAPGTNGKPNTLAQVNFAYASTFADYLVDNVSVISDVQEQVPGDANNDGKVDGSDVTILAGNWQAGVPDGDLENVTWEMGDFNGDGKVDGSDVTILAGNWQYGVEAAASAVPEPSTCILFVSLGLFAFLGRQRHCQD